MTEGGDYSPDPNGGECVFFGFAWLPSTFGASFHPDATLHTLGSEWPTALSVSALRLLLHKESALFYEKKGRFLLQGTLCNPGFVRFRHSKKKDTHAFPDDPMVTGGSNGQMTRIS